MSHLFKIFRKSGMSGKLRKLFFLPEREESNEFKETTNASRQIRFLIRRLLEFVGLIRLGRSVRIDAEHP